MKVTLSVADAATVRCVFCAVVFCSRRSRTEAVLVDTFSLDETCTSFSLVSRRLPCEQCCLPYS